MDQRQYVADMQKNYEAFNSSADFYSNFYEPEDLFTFGQSYNARKADRAAQMAADAFNAKEAGLQRIFEMEEAQKNRDFQRDMSNTAYQRAVKDLQSAGFSPLALLSSGAASSPSGSAASGSSASFSSGPKTRKKEKSGVSDIASLVIRVLGLIALKG